MAADARLLYEIFEHTELAQDGGEESQTIWWPIQSSSGTAVALVRDATASIFTEEDNFERSQGSFQASSALGPARGAPVIRATHASWTPAGVEPERLAVAFSSGFVHILNRGGKEEAELTRPEWVKAGGLAGAVLRGGQDGARGTAPAKAKGPELLALGKEAILWRTPFEAASPATGQLSSLTSEYYRPQIDMREQHPKGAFCLAYCASQSTATVLGPGCFTDASGQSVPFSVSVWHLTSSAPFHRLLFSAGAVKPSRFETLRRPAWAQIPALPKALCSPDGCQVSTLDSSKSLRVLNLGPEGKGPVSLVQIGAGTDDDDGTALARRQAAGESASPLQLGAGENSQSGGSEASANVHDVAWWSDDALLLSRADGAVTVGKPPGLVNMLGESAEKFGASPRVTGVVKKRAFVLDGIEEIEEEREKRDEGVQQGATTTAPAGILGRLSGWFRRTDALAPPIRTWRLTSLVERSPLEMMSVHIRHEEYGAALSLAKLYSLDTDLAYKARWERSDFGPASIGDNLGKIRDRRWVIGECLRRVPKTAEAMRALLQYGLQETGKWRYPEKGDGWEVEEEALEVPEVAEAAGAQSSGDGEAWWFRERRLQLLRSSDLLATFLVIHNNRFSADKFAAFQAGSLKDLAVQFAQACSAGPLEVLLKRHTHSLAEDWLEVLDAMPETVVPYSIRSLLPGPRPLLASTSRRPDWIESEETLAAIKSGSLPAAAAESTEELAKLSKGLVWPSGDELSEWYKARAVAIDSKSGLLEHSLYLLTLGTDLGVRGLERLSEDVQDLYEVVYSGKASEEASGAVDLSLVEWLGMDGFERYCNVMSGATKEDVVIHLEGPADRVARRWAERQEETPKSSGGPEEAGESTASPETGGDATSMSPSESFPRRWLLQQAEKGALGLVSTALPGSGVNKRLLSHEQVLETALECVYTCQATDAWDEMAALLGDLMRPKSLTPSGSPRAQGVSGKGDGVKQGPQAMIGGSPPQPAPSIAALALGPAGSKRARVAGFLQSAAERAAGQRGVAGFFSRLPKKIGPGKGEEGGMAEILANLPRTGGETAGANAPPAEFENALESFEGEEGAALEEDAGHKELGDDVAAGADVAARERLEGLEKRVLRAERHVRAGRILAKQQMARPLAFFLTCDADPSGVKQLIRRLLAWASRSNGPDAQWDALWNDLTALQSDAFTFLDTQYLLSEFVRALLRAGRLSLARGYVSGGKKRPPLLADKAETLVLGAAREYFYSAAALDSIDIRHARECLDLLPGNAAAAADRDLMEALTVHLPKLGVELLPLQYKQLKDKEEALQMALAAHDKAYLKLPDLLHVSTLLGLSTSTEQSRIKSLAADAAFASGDVRFALTVCLELVDENYHPAWALAAAMGNWAGGTSSENLGQGVGPADRKKLLGFAIANVEDGGMDELLRVWEGVDLALRCEEVLRRGIGAGLETGLQEGYLRVLLRAPGAAADVKPEDRSGMEILRKVARVSDSAGISSIAVAFARVYLPGLAKVCLFDKASRLGEVSFGELERGHSAGMLIRTALSQSGLAASDELLAQLAGIAWALGTDRASEGGAETSDAPASAHSRHQYESVALSCLLAMGPDEGASFVEKVVQHAQAFAEVERATRLAVHFYGIQALTLAADKGPREIENLLHLSTEELLAKMRKQPDRASEESAGGSDAESGLRKKGLDYGARLAALKDAKGLEGVLPGVDIDRFASGDQEHQQELVMSLVTAPGGQERRGSQPPETRTFEEQSAALRKALALAERYGVDTWRVLICHVQTLVLSSWPDTDVAYGVRESQEGLSGREVELMHALTSDVWPALGGTRHNRLALVFSLMDSIWRKLPPDAQTDFAKSWSPPGSALSFPDFFPALRCANLILMPSAPEADFKALLEPFRNGSLSGILGLVQSHVTLLNAEAMVGTVQELERAFSARSDATPGRIHLAAVRRRFADVITEADNVSKEGSVAVPGAARSGSGNGSEKEVPGIQELASAYDDSKGAIGNLGPEDLEGLFSDVLRWAYEAGGPSEPGEALRLRTRLYEDASALFKAAAFENPRANKRLEELAADFAEAGAVLKAVKEVKESGDVSDSQAAAAERSVPSWPESGTRSGAESEASPGGVRYSALKALVLVGVPYRPVKKMWTELHGQEAKGESEEGRSESEGGGSPEEAHTGGLTGQRNGGLVAVYRSALEEALSRGNGSVQAGSQDGLELVLAGLADEESSEDGGELDSVRREVWTRIKAFMDDPAVPLRRKIRTLELLNSLEDKPGQGGNPRVWKGWRLPPGSEETKQGGGVPGSNAEGPHPPRTSLLLLKTAEIVQGEWPDREVDDVSTVPACEALFRTLVADVGGSSADISTESGDVREESASGAGVFEARVGALFGLLRLWEANSAAFGSETGGGVEQGKEGGGAGTGAIQEGAETSEGSEGAKSAEEEDGKAIVQDGSSSVKTEEKGERSRDEEKPTVLESEGERDAEKKGSDLVGRAEAAAEQESEEEGTKISRFHGSAKLLLSVLLTSRTPRAALVVLDRWTGDDVISPTEALELTREAEETIGSVAAAKVALMSPLADKTERAVSLLTSWTGTKSGGERKESASYIQRESAGVGKGAKESESRGESGQVSEIEPCPHVSDFVAAARREFDKVDADLLGLVLAHELLPKIAHEGGTHLLRALCLAVTPLARDQQQLLLSNGPQSPGVNPLAAVAFSCLVAELAACQMYGFAGALVLQYLRVPPALATWDGAPEALLRYLRYLKRKLPQHVRIARGLNRALSAAEGEGLLGGAYLVGPVEEIAKRVVRLSSKALNALVQDLK